MAAPRLRRFWYDPKGNRSGPERHEPLSGLLVSALDERSEKATAEGKVLTPGKLYPYRH